MSVNRLDYISILRTICILVVVFFHCYGMMYAEAHFPETVSVYKQLYFIPNQCVFINIAMPMFVFISGYLFEYLLQKGKYPTWGNLLQKKGVRILLPYFVFGLFFMATTGKWHPLQLLNGGYWHLWFLPMLFWSFIAGYGIYKMKFNTYVEVFLLLICFLGTFIPMFLPMWLGLHHITRWFYWFYLGMLFFKYKNCIFPYLNKYKLYWISFVIYGVITYFHPVGYCEDCWYIYLVITGCIISIIYIIDKVDWSKFKTTNTIVKFSRYSFGIYIWHYWVATMLISNTSKQLFGLPTLAANYTILFPLCFSLLTLAISWGVSWCMMKTKSGRFLIG